MRATRPTLPLTLLAFLLAPSLTARLAHARPPHLERPALSWDGPPAPWRARMRRDDDAPQPNGLGLIDASRWPPEPASPSDLTASDLASGLRQVCGLWMPQDRPTRYAEWILEHSRHFGVDPLVVAGLVVSRSQCRPKHTSAEGIGLSQIHDKMHWAHLHDRVYRYGVFEGGTWAQRQLDLSLYQFTRHMLRAAAANIYFTAGLLRVAMDQCPHNDGAFGSVPHRHPVSHLIWGDRVRGTDGEDRALRVRRMLIEHITGVRAAAHGEYRGLSLVSPLDGAPRKITSAMGDDRDGGKRKHEGVDFSSHIGEPVRAVADGAVIFAGTGGANLRPGASGSVRGKALGKAGIYVKVQHEGDIVSAYMHLSRALVRRGQHVAAGQIIGHVGRTGIQRSAAHLHFELRYQGERVDPLPALGRLVFAPADTWRGLRLKYEAWKRRREGGSGPSSNQLGNR